MARHELVHGSRDADYAGGRLLGQALAGAGGTADLKGYLEANTVFYGAVGASFVYFWNWFRSLSPDDLVDHWFWVVLGAAMPILMVVAGIRLWKYAANAKCRVETAAPVRRSAEAT